MWETAATLLAPAAIGSTLTAVTVAARRTRQAAQDRARAQAYRAVLDHAHVGIAVLVRGAARSWRVEDANPALAGLLHRDVMGAVWPDLVAGADRDCDPARTARTLDALVDGGLRDWHGELTVERTGRTLHVSLAPLPAGAGAPRVAVQVVDVTDRVSEQLRLRDLALHDPLTGLPNRTLLGDRLDLALAGTRRTGARVLVAFCDLDDFKQVNDTSGHAAGDEVLVTVAERLREAVRPADTVARVGGDEFVVLCPDVPDETVAAHIADRLLAALHEPVILDGGLHHRGGSVGVALSAAGRRADASALLQAADVAMYRAKRSGKGAAHLLILADDEDVFLDGVVDVRRPVPAGWVQPSAEPAAVQPAAVQPVPTEAPGAGPSGDAPSPLPAPRRSA